MQACARCEYPIPSGEEIWMRRKSSNERTPLCSQCAAELRRKKSQQKQTTKKQRPTPQPSVATHKPSKVPIDSVLILTLIVLVLAPIMGALFGIITNYINLIFLFPLGAGVVSGLVLHKGIRWGKLRDPAVAAIFGLLFGLSFFTAYRYANYQMLRREAITIIMEDMMVEFGEADSEFANMIFHEFLYEETGYTGFIGATLLEANEGMSIARTRGRSPAFNVGSTLTWLYWLFEAMVIIAFPMWMGANETKRPYCEAHDRWYTNEKSLGGLAPDGLGILSLLDDGKFAEFATALNTTVPIPGVEICIEHCPNCEQSSPRLTIKRVTKTSRGRKDEKVLAQHYISPAEGNTLIDNAALAA